MSLWHWLVSSVLAICWLLFLVVWIAGAIYNARKGPGVERRGGGVSRWAFGGVVIWLVLRYVPGLDWLSVRIESEWVRVLGAAILVAATAFTLWARAALGTMWSSEPVAKEGHELRTDGPYAITRYPIYTGIVGMLLGTALAIGLGPFVWVFVVGVVFLELKIRAEERLMTDVFPDAYDEYRRQVPQLVPGLYAVTALWGR